MERAYATYQCRCGRTVFSGFAQPPMCHGCAWCGTVLSDIPALRIRPLQHEVYQEQMVIDEIGREITVRICKFCESMAPVLGSGTVPTLATISL